MPPQQLLQRGRAFADVARVRMHEKDDRFSALFACYQLPFKPIQLVST